MLDHCKWVLLMLSGRKSQIMTYMILQQLSCRICMSCVLMIKDNLGRQNLVHVTKVTVNRISKYAYS